MPPGTGCLHEGKQPATPLGHRLNSGPGAARPESVTKPLPEQCRNVLVKMMW